MFCLLNESPNWSVTCHVCMRSGIHRQNNHRKLDKTFKYITICVKLIFIAGNLDDGFIQISEFQIVYYRYSNTNN